MMICLALCAVVSIPECKAQPYNPANFELPCAAGSTPIEAATFNPSTNKYRAWVCADPFGNVTSPVFVSGGGQFGAAAPGDVTLWNSSTQIVGASAAVPPTETSPFTWAFTTSFVLQLGEINGAEGISGQINICDEDSAQCSPVPAIDNFNGVPIGTNMGVCFLDSVFAFSPSMECDPFITDSAPGQIHLGSGLQFGGITLQNTNSQAQIVNAGTGSFNIQWSIPPAPVNNFQAFSLAYDDTSDTFTATGCSNSTKIGSSFAGSFHSGTSGTCTVTITMGDTQTAPNGWACYANDLTTPADVIHQTLPVSTTQATLSGTTVSGDVIVFSCHYY